MGDPEVFFFLLLFFMLLRDEWEDERKTETEADRESVK